KVAVSPCPKSLEGMSLIAGFVGITYMGMSILINTNPSTEIFGSFDQHPRRNTVDASEQAILAKFQSCRGLRRVYFEPWSPTLYSLLTGTSSPRADAPPSSLAAAISVVLGRTLPQPRLGTVIFDVDGRDRADPFFLSFC
ncbi:MAG: hypothetical protein AAF206_11850, partial [Bacteroidota bacterium]